MNRLIKQLGVGDNFSIKTTVAVEELMNHDMIYIYHHLQPGTVLTLENTGVNLQGDPRYAVKYKNFMLGFITISGIMKSFYEGQQFGQAEISAMSKDKYQPIKELDVQVGVQAMKKVG